MTKSKILNVKCDLCDIEYSRRYNLEKTPKRKYCSNNCRMSDKNSFLSEWSEERREKYSKQISGQNNPNYGKRWNSEQKEKASKKQKLFFLENEEARYKAGSSNRGKKFSEDRIRSMHDHRPFESYSRPCTEEAKIKIGLASKSKFTEEYNIKVREKMERLGHWLPIEEKDPYDLYYKDSNWVTSMISEMTKNQIYKINSIGFFSVKKNKIGLVRDHILSRKTGWELKIPAIIIRHPCNMQLLTNKENISKGFKDRIMTDEDKNKLCLDLINKIKTYRGSWFEHDLTLKAINDYLCER